jgi:hypothetical protein
MPYSVPVSVTRSGSRQIESQHISDRQAIALAVLDQTHLGRFPYDLRAEIGILKCPGGQAMLAGTRTPIE